MPSIKPLHLSGKDIRRAGPGDFVGPEHGGTGVTSLAELKEELNLSSVDNTSDADKPISNAVASALADKASVGAPAQAINDARGAPNGIAALGSDGKIPESQLPSIAIIDAFVVADQAAMLALTVQRGDMAIRMDLESTFVMAGDTNILANWIQLRTPSGAVLSVAGKVGNIILAAADVGLGNVDDTSDADKPISTATAAALNLKQGKEAGKGLSSNDYTNADKTKLAVVGGIASAAQANAVVGYGRAFPVVVDAILDSSSELPPIDPLDLVLLRKIFVIGNAAFAPLVQMSSVDPTKMDYVWNEAAIAKVGQKIINRADGLTYEFSGLAWVEVPADSLMASISDKQGKVLDDRILISDWEDVRDGITTKGGYLLANDGTNGYLLASLVDVVETGGIIAQVIKSPIFGQISRYYTEDEGWSDYIMSVNSLTVMDWYSAITTEAPNAVINSDGTFSRSLASHNPNPLLVVSGGSHAFVKTDVNKYARYTSTGAKAATFDSSEGFTAGDAFHITNRAASGNITISGTGVTFNAPKNGTLVLEPKDTVTVKFISPTEADVIGSTEVA